MIETLASLYKAAGHDLPPIPRRSRYSATHPYDATSGQSRVRGWNPTSQGINDLLYSNLEGLRTKAADLVRRNPWATNAVDSFVGNCIGTGIVPVMTKHPDAKEKNRVQELFLRWTDQADANNLTDFYGLQALACRTSMISGECIIRLRDRRPEDKLPVAMQLQVLPPEHLPLYTIAATPVGANKIRYGIEFDAIGRRVAYHLYREHPNESALLYTNQELSRVLAESVLHLYKPLEASQQRGAPWLTPVLATLYDLEKYDAAELIRKKCAAMIVAFERTVGDVGGGDVLGEQVGDDGVGEEGLEPGRYYRLPEGKDVTFNNAVDVGGMYAEFMRFQLRKIAAGLGITFEMLTGDLSLVNYSSIRAGTLEFRRRCEAFQHQVMVFQFCRPVWRAWIRQAVLGGQINVDRFNANPQYYLDVEWRPQAWKWVDPLKDVAAEVLAIDNLLKPRSATIAETGEDRETTDRRIAEDQKSEEDKGLVRGESSARAVEPNDEEQPQPERQRKAAWIR
jgi:lambda family phage portal protein